MELEEQNILDEKLLELLCIYGINQYKSTIDYIINIIIENDCHEEKESNKKMKLAVRNLLKEKLFELKQIMFDMYKDEYNSKFYKRNYATLKDTIEQYKNVIDDIDSILEKYC